MKLPLPLSYMVTIAVTGGVGIYMLLVLTNTIAYDTVFQWVTFFTLEVFTLAVFAVMGGVLLGMFIATRSLSSQGFTPFEVSMLKMHDDIHNLQREIAALQQLLERGGRDSEPPE